MTSKDLLCTFTFLARWVILAMLKIFLSAEICCLCGDRKFIGKAWLRYLLLEPVLAFCLRIRATDKIEHKGRI